jgi:putative ABC transport system permease protein
MSIIRTLRRRIRALFSKAELDSELNDEMRLHIALETEELIRTGVTPDEAARRARIAFGGVERHKDETRDVRGVRSLEDTLRGIAYTLRSLRRAPAFTLAVVFSLALGIGANSTMFTIINAVLLRQLPFPHADELVSISTVNKGTTNERLHEPYFHAWHDASRTLASVALYNPTSATFAGNTDPELVPGSAASTDLFGVLQLRPALGRFFNGDDEAAGAPKVVILSDALWRRHFAADSAIVGRVIQVNEKPVTVVGVMPPGLEFPQRAEFWTLWKTSVFGPGGPGFMFFVQIVARPRPGVSLADAQREISAIATDAGAHLPVFARNEGFVVMSLHDQIFGSVRPALRILFAAVLLLLLIACANVANLVFARTMQRQREFAVRVTLGAARATLIWLVLAESALLAIAGAVVGLLLSVWATRLFVRLSPAGISNVSHISVDVRVFVFTAVIAMGAALLVGVGPAVRAAQRDPRLSLGEGGSREGSGRFAARIRSALVACQLAIAVVLLVGAGLLIKSVEQLNRIDLGFRAEHVLVVNIPLSRARYSEPARARQFFNQLAARLKGVPGVLDAAYGTAPLQGFAGSQDLPATLTHPAVSLGESDVGPDYFETYGVPMREGRGILSSDDSASAPVAVLNASAAKAFFPDGNAIGREFEGSTVGTRHPTVVGIVPDVAQRDVAVRPMAEVYTAAAQNDGFPYSIAVRTMRDAEAIVPFVRGAVRDLDPATPVGKITTMERVVASSIAPAKFASLLLGVFAVLALVLATLGLYGVIAYGVARRSRELGIRAALGATGGALVRLVAGEMVWVVGLGLLVGIAGAWMLSRVLHSLLYGTGVHDPLTFVLVPIALLATAAVATLLPARKAMRVNPLDVMQAE